MVGGPIRGRAAVIEYGTTAIGKVKNITLTATEDVIKDYSMDQVTPEVLAPGDLTLEFTAEKLWVDSVYVNLLLNQTYTGISIIIYPAGKNSGETAFTLTNVILSRWNLTADKDGVVLSGIRGEGQTLTVGVYVPP